ncbi:aminotransferase class I/II-fold pyridoxal phosphate-dependent enzyme [Geothrix sp. 21YS21S-2]|uniref:pyridoxal phosphate-dependent decarboxylase family protein n=1 Tax=Geothrix sp. 21YS21S-2 TaxID=3068893 RepID=UPI0027BAC389|nr:aminotransferase class I/II-fold pyridoxal phosphate-dependent enzyme [Geothrix sp. 21YS21S-2]
MPDNAYDPETFRALGHRAVDALADHLAQVQGGTPPVLPWREPPESLRAWPADFTRGGGADPMHLIARVLEGSHHLQHPRYVGHQCSAPLPLTALLGMVADLLNNGTAVYEMGPVSTAMERSLVQWFSGLAGYDPARAGGVLTHGGSAGNLTALLAARQASTPYDVWEEGYRAPMDLCLLASDQTHYSVRRSAQVLGLGGRNVIAVPTDERFRMRPEALEAALDEAEARGRRVLAVVGSAGSTATGAIDPLEDIAAICEARGVWFHVDGAHSGAFLVSDRLRPRLAGIGRAHSLVIDAHKMLMMPSLATAVLFRDEGHSFETFSQQASYLFDRSARQEWYNLAHRTLECTKRFLSLDLYVALQVLGTDYFARYLESRVDLASWFADAIEARPGWELAVRPEGNIVCFRAGGGGDAFQSAAREAIVREGSFHLVKTQLRGRTWLRTTLINPLTTRDDLTALMDRLDRPGTP